jgi:hypothetical protein
MITDRFVPKVHPATREVEADDPLELIAEAPPGDPELMLTCVVQEFAGLGLGADAIFTLFRSPNYPALNQLLARYGPADICRRIDDLLHRGGVFRVRETFAEPDPEPEDDEPELIQLTVRQRFAQREY